MDISDEQLAICLDVLQQLAQHPKDIEKDDRLTPIKSLISKLYRANRKAERKRKKQRDRLRKESTTLVHQQQKLVLCQEINEGNIPQGCSPQNKADAVLVQGAQQENGHGSPEHKQRSPQFHISTRCYICKQPYRQIHHFYHLLCPTCAELNYQKRQAHTDLRGRTALVTGGRIKIGYQTALRMLQDGAHVIVTTRFPRDCARRYSQEADFDQWRDRLQIYGLDLRNIIALEDFIAHLLHTESALDILINNAAQTIKRPQSFYQHLLDQEEVPLRELPQVVQSLICWSEGAGEQGSGGGAGERGSGGARGRRGGGAEELESKGVGEAQIQNLKSKIQNSIDFRPLNSWLLKLEEVSTVELLEVQVVNAIAPFILNSKLKPLLMASPFERRFIINVSAMEGQFNRNSKTAAHPHTNMAKAALNMMTRTSAQDYADDNIFMNSVDTGWVTNENPHPKVIRLQTEDGFYPPLDSIDGMARIYDPIVQGLQMSDLPLFGYFLKDYMPYPW
ncbi:MAG: SDR family oxidoreductase [Cyanobacteria bacterium P01_F01_bin.150]